MILPLFFQCVMASFILLYLFLCFLLLFSPNLFAVCPSSHLCSICVSPASLGKSTVCVCTEKNIPRQSLLTSAELILSFLCYASTVRTACVYFHMLTNPYWSAGPGEGQVEGCRGMKSFYPAVQNMCGVLSDFDPEAP